MKRYNKIVKRMIKGTKLDKKEHKMKAYKHGKTNDKTKWHLDKTHKNTIIEKHRSLGHFGRTKTPQIISCYLY